MFCSICIVFSSFILVFRCIVFFFFFKQKTAYEMRISDWSSDVCSSDLLVDALRSARGTILLVANEVGLGIVPGNALARRFRDEAGHLNQSIAATVGQAWFLAAGLALRLK